MLGWNIWNRIPVWKYTIHPHSLLPRKKKRYHQVFSSIFVLQDISRYLSCSPGNFAGRTGIFGSGLETSSIRRDSQAIGSVQDFIVGTKITTMFLKSSRPQQRRKWCNMRGDGRVLLLIATHFILFSWSLGPQITELRTLNLELRLVILKPHLSIEGCP